MKRHDFNVTASDRTPGPDGNSPPEGRPFVLDTDIGTDVDDLLAVALVLGSSDLALSAVTTVYGDVRLRAAIVAHTYAAAGVHSPPIAPGIAETFSGRAVWWPGHEGALMEGLALERFNGSPDAIGVLAGAGTVVAIGPLTNIAAALARHDHEIDQILMMGCEFQRGVSEHNILADVVAADAVFASGVPVTVVSLDQTQRLQITEESLGRFQAGTALGALLVSEIRQFWRFTDREFNIPHDPVAVMMLARPDLFALERGRVTMERSGEAMGRTHFRPDPHGPHRVVVDLDVEALTEEIVARVSESTFLSMPTLDEEKTK